MITSHQLQDDLVEVKVSGPIVAEDYKSLRSSIEEMLRDQDQIELLMLVESLDEMTPQAMWEDLKMAEFLDHFERMAIVTDKDWLDRMMDAADMALDVELKHFEVGQRKAALQWLTS